MTDPGDAPTLSHVWVGSDRARAPRLVAFWGPHVVSAKLPQQGTITIGRGIDCELRIDDPTVSRQHARLHVAESGWRIEDLGSANGTWLGGQRIAPSSAVHLAPGQFACVGAATLFVQLTGERVSNAPASVPEGAPWPAHGPMARVMQLIALVARGDLSVLLLGETGVGKEVAAELLHRLSPRNGRAFVRVNCAALPETLLESELFGHERGAFTGADRAKLGLIEAADGGTLLLDEVGELPSATQAKLLRVLETRELTRVGSVLPRSVDVRFVAATNEDLGKAVQEGRFRRDLFYRLNGICLLIPPLRERREEIEPLAQRFVAAAAHKLGRSVPVLSADAVQRLLEHPWLGNVRELKNVIERALLLCQGDRIDREHLALELDARLERTSSIPPPGSPRYDLRSALADAEQDQIERALAEVGGNQTRAAKLLGVSRRTLVAKIAEYGIGRNRRG